MKKNSLYDIEYFEKIRREQGEKLKRLKNKRLIITVIVLIFILYLFLPISKINNISIVGNNRYSVAKIKEQAGVEVGQFNILNPSFLISKRLADTNLYQDVQVDGSLFGNVRIKVKENRLLFYQVQNKKVVFSDSKNNSIMFDTSDAEYLQAQVPDLSSNVNDKIKADIVESLSKLDISVLNEISEIIYTPKSYDDHFFRFIMNNHKEVYINANLKSLVNIGDKYHAVAANTKYACSSIELIDNVVVEKKCA